MPNLGIEQQTDTAVWGLEVLVSAVTTQCKDSQCHTYLFGALRLSASAKHTLEPVLSCM